MIGRPQRSFVQSQQAVRCNVPNYGSSTWVPMHEDQHTLSYCCTFEDAVLGELVAASDDNPPAHSVVTRKRYFRRRRVRLSARLRLPPELRLLSRFAFAATCCRYRRTISSLEAPAIRRALASKAASIFSLTISLASRRALLPPRISFIIRSATTPFASTASIIKDLNIRRPLTCL